MNGRYEAAFIIPFGSNRVLGDHGWEFESASRLSPDVVEFLVRALNLKLSESYLGIDSYVDSNIKMSVFRDDKGGIESIHFQVYEDTMTTLERICQADSITENAELFIPGHEGLRR